MMLLDVNYNWTVHSKKKKEKFLTSRSFNITEGVDYFAHKNIELAMEIFLIYVFGGSRRYLNAYASHCTCRNNYDLIL